MTEIDPWDIIRVPKTVTKVELKQEYKRLAKIFHPDKPKGYRKKFQILNWSYREIKKYILSRDSSFNSLKKGSQQSAKEAAKVEASPAIAKMATQDFDIKKFNQLFDQWHVPQVKKRVNKPPPEKANFPKVVNGNITGAYDAYIQEVVPEEQRVNRLEQFPSAKSQQTALAQQQLGVTEIDDYTDYTNNGLMMTDYHKAFEPQYLPTIEEEPINMNATKHQRSQKITVDPEEHARFNEHRMMIDQERNQRHHTQQRLDEEAAERFNRMTLHLTDQKL
jgi:curved DNA-binding protein CbpA